MTVTSVDCPLLRTARLGPTDYWNDSCAVEELAYAIERGATGATSNPPIVLEVLGKEKAHWSRASTSWPQRTRPGPRWS